MDVVSSGVAAAATLLWLGMVLAISFLEAPLKFRAPGLELRVGLAIGRIVFRALNLAELVWAVVIAACLLLGPRSPAGTVLAVTAGLVLAIQLAVVRPRLNRRSDQVLAGRVDPARPRSRAHHAYVGLETLKVVVLAALGCYLLAP
jgi:hypothetical protein